MKTKQIACAAAAALCVGGGVGVAHAQAAGNIVVNAGWMHFAPQDSSGPFKINALGQTMTAPGAGASCSAVTGRNGRPRCCGAASSAGRPREPHRVLPPPREHPVPPEGLRDALHHEPHPQ